MTVPKETEADILRLHFAEKWPKNTIAKQLSLHHSVVERVLINNGVRQDSLRVRPSIADPYVDFIKATLEKYNDITATRLFHMVKERGYTGGVDHFRDIVARYRPRLSKSAYLRLKTLPGEQAQVDWGHFGRFEYGKAKRPLMAFVMVLSWSRQIFLRFYPGAGMGYFLQGHVDAFTYFEGCARDLLYDNLKSAVLERRGDAIRFNPTLIELSGHYHFAAKPVNVARGNEKGRCERAIRFIRDSFFAGRKWTDLDDLNRQAIDWCHTIAAERKWMEDRSQTVGQAFELEKQSLLPLPADHFPAHDMTLVRVGKTPYVKYDLNSYSVPYTHVGKSLTVMATLDTVRILDGAAEVARHKRSFDRDQQVEDPSHIEKLIERKREAKQHRGMDRLNYAVPSSRFLFEKAASRGQNLGALTTGLLTLLDQYGQDETERAVQHVLQTDATHVSAVRQTLEQRQREKGLPPPVAVQLPDDSRLRDIVVKPHSLEGYDNLHNICKEDEQ
jgi:transposase